MKKFLIFAIIVFIPLMYSCKEKIVTYENSGETIGLVVGQYLKIQLSSNASTGNIWRKTSYDNTIMGRAGKPNYMLGDDGAMGSAGTLNLRFKALKKGKTTLKMEYGSRFEEQSPPVKEFVLEINVVDGQ